MNGISERIASVVDVKYKGNKSAFAREINITPAYAAQLYSGQRIPSDRTVIDICRVCGVNEVWLKTGSGEMCQALTENEELAAYVSDVMRDEPESFRKRLILESASWTPEIWKMLEQICKRLANENPDTD